MVGWFAGCVVLCCWLCCSNVEAMSTSHFNKMITLIVIFSSFFFLRHSLSLNCYTLRVVNHCRCVFVRFVFWAGGGRREERRKELAVVNLAGDT